MKMIAVILGFTAGLIAVFGFVAYRMNRSEKLWKALTLEIALAHGGSAEGKTEKNAVRDLCVYEWQSDAFRVILGGGSAAAGRGTVRVKATKGLVMVVYPDPLPFKLEIRQGRGIFTGDPEFDRCCRVETDNPLKTRRLLESPDLRRAICRMIHSMIHKVGIREGYVSAMFYDRREFKAGVDETIKLAKQIYRRATEEAGLLK